MTSSKFFYQNCLSEDLQQHVHAQLAKLLPEQLDLKEEVAIQRERCADLVKEWSDTRSAYNNILKLEPSPQRDVILNRTRMAMDAAGQHMADAYKEQKELVLTAAAVESKTREALTERTIMLFLNATIELARELFNNGTKESIQLMTRFEHMIRERIVLQEADGNALAIEGEVWAMMNTIGSPPEYQSTQQENKGDLLSQ